MPITPAFLPIFARLLKAAIFKKGENQVGAFCLLSNGKVFEYFNEREVKDFHGTGDIFSSPPPAPARFRPICRVYGTHFPTLRGRADIGTISTFR